MNIWPIIKSVGGAEVIIYEIRRHVFTFEVWLYDLKNSKNFWAELENRSSHISVDKRLWGKELKVRTLGEKSS